MMVQSTPRAGRRAILTFLGASGLAVLASATGCVQHQERAMAAMKTPESKLPGEVLREAEGVLRERFYQVRVSARANHIVALTPIELEGNHPVRRKIDVWVFQENGFYMPKVFVRKYIDVAEPPAQKGGAITGRFPIEVNGYPVAADDWQPLIYDRTQEEEIRNAILTRLKIAS